MSKYKMSYLVLDGNGIIQYYYGSIPNNLVIPNTCTGLNGNPFDTIGNLVSVTIPNTFTTLGTNAFQGCSNLTSITITGELPSGAFTGNPFSTLQTSTPGTITTTYGNYTALSVSGQLPGNWTVTPTYMPPQFSVGGNTFPEKVTSVSVTSGEVEQTTVTWTDLSNNSITAYTVTAFDGTNTPVASVVWLDGPLSEVITGLIGSLAYTVTVTPSNVDGDGPASDPETCVPAPPSATVPAAVETPVAASGEYEQSTVTWAPPGSDGGSAIVSYTITTYLSSGFSLLKTDTVNESALTLVAGNYSYAVTGLTNGTAYKFTIVATNAVGSSSSSDASDPATPSNSGPVIPVGPGGGGGGGGVPCFPKGTRITTQLGPVLVETLRTGDLVLTADGRQVPVKVYYKVIESATAETAPYHISKKAFGLKADLNLSPLHAFQSKKGVWQIPKYAANPHVKQYGIGSPVTYFHLECPNYFTDNLIVDGCVVESYGAAQAKNVKVLYKFNEKLDGYTRASQVANLKK